MALTQRTRVRVSLCALAVVALFNAIEKHQHQSGKKTDEKSDKKGACGCSKLVLKLVCDHRPAYRAH